MYFTCQPLNKSLSTVHWRHMGGVACQISDNSNVCQPFLYAYTKENINAKLSVTVPLWGESTGDRWIPFTSGQPETRKKLSCRDVFMVNGWRLNFSLVSLWNTTNMTASPTTGNCPLISTVCSDRGIPLTKGSSAKFRRHDMEMFFALLAFSEGNPSVTGGLSWSLMFPWCLIWDDVSVMWRHCKATLTVKTQNDN